MLKDIKNREDIEFLMNAFYKELLVNDQIGFIFTDVIALELDTHLPIICNFWEAVLFHRPIYNGNIMKVHIELDKKEPLKKEYFEIWQQLFIETLDKYFTGKNTDEAKRRVALMAPLIQYKINRSRENNFIQ